MPANIELLAINTRPHAGGNVFDLHAGLLAIPNEIADNQRVTDRAFQENASVRACYAIFSDHDVLDVMLTTTGKRNDDAVGPGFLLRDPERASFNHQRSVFQAQPWILEQNAPREVNEVNVQLLKDEPRTVPRCRG